MVFNRSCNTELFKKRWTKDKITEFDKLYDTLVQLFKSQIST